jgi:hypothetical protein
MQSEEISVAIAPAKATMPVRQMKYKASQAVKVSLE